MTSVLHKLEQGIVAGVIGTVPMTAAMFTAQKLGLLGKMPPAKITDELLAQADIPASRPQRRVLTTLAHLGFGAGCGAAYALLRPGRPSLRRAATEGVVFATGVWAASYAGWIPALGIMPPPEDDRPDRQISMVIAHWIFGAVTGVVVAARRR